MSENIQKKSEHVEKKDHPQQSVEDVDAEMEFSASPEVNQMPPPPPVKASIFGRRADTKGFQFLQGYIQQLEGDDDAQSFHSRMDRGTIVKPRILELEDKSMKLFEQYRDRTDTIGRDARLMSITINKAHKRLSMRHIGGRVNSVYQTDIRQTFKERRQTMKQSLHVMNKLMLPEEQRFEDKKQEIRNARAKIKLTRLSTPMFITNACVAQPTIIFLVICGLLIFTTVFGYVSGHFQLKPSHYRENFAWDNDLMRDWDAQEAAKLDLLGSADSEAPTRIQLLDKMTGQILFQGKEGTEDLLQKDYLIEIQRFERQIKQMLEARWSKLCWATSTSDSACNENAWMSPLRFLDGKDASDQDQEEINKAFWANYDDKSKIDSGDQQFHDSYLYPHREIIASQGKVTYLRAIINFGAPLDIDGVRYKNLNDKWSEQFQIIKDFQLEIDKLATDMYYNSDIGILKPQFYSSEVKNEEFKRVTENDTYYLFVSVAFVMFWLLIHLKSTFLTFISMLIIAFSFGTTGLICEYIVGMTYFNIFNNFAIFVILGIAADDFFVFFDAWNQSGQFKGVKKDHQKRLAFTMRRASRTMFMTSVTTSVAFLATFFSPIMPVRAFGIYSAILVPMVFILTCLILPPAVIIYDIHFSTCWCYKKVGEKKIEKNVSVTRIGEPDQQQDNQQTARNLIQNNGAGQQPSPVESPASAEQPASGEKLVDQKDKQEPAADLEGGADERLTQGDSDEEFEEFESTNLSPLESFFGGFWNRQVYNCRYLILLIFIIWSVFAVGKAIDIKPLAKQENTLPSDNYVIKTYNIIQDSFRTLPMDISTQNEMTFFFGVSDLIKDDVDQWNPADLGKIQFDADLDITSIEGQTSLKQFCTQLKEADFVSRSQVNCWFDEFEKQIEGRYTIPIADKATFEKELKTFATSPVGKKLEQSRNLVFIDDKVKYFQITATTQGKAWEDLSAQNDLDQSTYSFVRNYQETAPAGLKTVKYVSELLVQQKTEKELQEFAIRGIAISLCFSFIVMLLVVCNVLIAFVALLCVGIVAASVIAIMVFQGYELVITESVSMIVLTGLAVDYVIHLAQSYIFSPQNQRSRKMKQAYQEMGVSIFSGMITTMGSSVFLFLGKIMLFEKLAVIILSTAAMSFLTSMLFFGAIMHVFGPQYNWGDLLVCDCCKAYNPIGVEAKELEQLEEQLEIEERQPKNIYDMMQEGQLHVINEDDDEKHSENFGSC